MDDLFPYLLIIHLGAFALGITTTIAAPLVGARLGKPSPEARAQMMPLMARLSLNARIALALLVLSGVSMMVVRYGGFEGQNLWFWTKMILVAMIVAALVATTVLPKTALNPRLMGWVTRLSMAGIVVSAVLAFR